MKARKGRRKGGGAVCEVVRGKADRGVGGMEEMS